MRHSTTWLFPKKLGDCALPVLKPIYRKQGFAEHRILTEWADIVGAGLAAFSVPQKISFRGKAPGTLLVLVAPGRALELQHMQPLILERIAVYFGYNAIGHILLQQSASPLFLKTRAPASVPTAPVAARAAHLLADCADEPLRRALQSLGEMIAGIENADTARYGDLRPASRT